VICVPASIVFGFSNSSDPPDSLAGPFCEINFSQAADLALKETSSMSRFENGEIEAIALAPLEKASIDPDTILIYGNPAQVMRLAQASPYRTRTGARISPCDSLSELPAGVPASPKELKKRLGIL
jgi:uncharacterized protein (DUF169 family)